MLPTLSFACERLKLRNHFRRRRRAAAPWKSTARTVVKIASAHAFQPCLAAAPKTSGLHASNPVGLVIPLGLPAPPNDHPRMRVPRSAADQAQPTEVEPCRIARFPSRGRAVPSLRWLHLRVVSLPRV